MSQFPPGLRFLLSFPFHLRKTTLSETVKQSVFRERRTGEMVFPEP